HPLSPTPPNPLPTRRSSDLWAYCSATGVRTRNPKTMKTKPTLALPVATVLVLLSASAMAQVTFYTSKAAFDAAASTTLLEDFEAFSPKNANLGTFTLHGLTYTSLN